MCACVGRVEIDFGNRWIGEPLAHPDMCIPSPGPSQRESESVRKNKWISTEGKSCGGKMEDAAEQVLTCVSRITAETALWILAHAQAHSSQFVPCWLGSSRINPYYDPALHIPTSHISFLGAVG